MPLTFLAVGLRFSTLLNLMVRSGDLSICHSPSLQIFCFSLRLFQA